jgi:hypothetical protein
VWQESSRLDKKRRPELGGVLISESAEVVEGDPTTLFQNFQFL